jgi:protein O-mannosyl-transferase
VNVALHGATVLALWGFWREVMRALVPARLPGEAEPVPYQDSPVLGLAIAVFALNPVAVYAVGYLIQRSIVMATLFVAVALWSFARGLRAGKPWLFILAALAYVAAVASKEHAILAPLAAVPVYVVVARPPARRLALLVAAGALLMGLMGWTLRARVGEIIGTPIDEYSRVYLAQLGALDPQAPARAWPLSIVNQAWLFLQYGLRWLLPLPGWMSINLRPPFPLSLGSFPQVLGVPAYLAALGGGAWLAWRHRDWKALLGLALLIPALLFATEFVIVWVQDPFVLYRSYLWAIGIPALVFCLLQGMTARVALGAGVVVGALLTWQAFDRVLSLDTPEHAWSDAIAKLPGDPRAVGRWFPYLNRGADYVERDELALALRDFQASESLGDLGMGAFNQGAVLAAQGRHAEALQAFDRAERQGYALYNLPFQRGLSLMALNRPGEAYAQFERTRALDPPSPTRELLLLDLGRLGLQLGHGEQAMKDLERLVALQPRDNREARYLLAMAYVTHGQAARAKPMLDALISEGGNAPAYYARALANYGLKRRDDALADIGEAMRRDPRNPMLRDWESRIRALPARP